VTHTVTPTTARWSGTVDIAPGRLAFTGEIGSAAPHRHTCLQLLIITTGEVILRDDQGEEQRVRAAIIPTQTRHEVLAEPGTTGLLALLDPAGPAGRAAAARVTHVGTDPRQVRTWIAATRPAPAPHPAPLHPGLARALRPGTHAGRAGLTDVAAQVGISASRLGHLFAGQLGLTYPSWRRWTRLLDAIQAVRAGATLTQAAHDAGFADSAHLSRTFRAMFGITPTEALHAAGWRP